MALRLELESHLSLDRFRLIALDTGGVVFKTYLDLAGLDETLRWCVATYGSATWPVVLAVAVLSSDASGSRRGPQRSDSLGCLLRRLELHGLVVVVDGSAADHTPEQRRLTRALLEAACVGTAACVSTSTAPDHSQPRGGADPQ